MQKQQQEEVGQKKKRSSTSSRQKWIRRVGYAGLGVVILIVICVVALYLLLSNLDNPTLAQWIKEELHQRAGLQVRFRTLSLSPFSGLEATDVRILNPEPFHQQAKNLLSVGKIQADWDFWPLLLGELRLGEVRIENVDLHLVVDKQTGNSLSTLTAGFAAPDEPDVELPETEKSRPIAQLMDQDRFGLTVEQFSLSQLNLEYIATDQGVKKAQHRLGAINAQASITPGPDGNKLHVKLTPSDSGLSFVWREKQDTTRWQEREALFDFNLALTTPEPKTLSVEGALTLVRQRAWSVPIGRQLLQVLAHIRFTPQEGRTSVTIDKLDALKQALTTTLEADLVERSDGSKRVSVRNIQVQLDASPLRPLLPASWGVGFGKTTGRLIGDNLQFRIPAPGAALPEGHPPSPITPKGGGKMTLQLELQEALIQKPALLFSLGHALLKTTIEMGDAWALDTHSQFKLTNVALKSGEVRLSLAQSQFDLAGKGLDLLSMQPISASGKITVQSSLNRFLARTNSQQLKLDQLGFNLRTSLDQRAVADLVCEVAMQNLSLSDSRTKSRLQLPKAVLRLDTPYFNPQFIKPATARLALFVESAQARHGAQRISLRRMRPVLEATIRGPHDLDVRTKVPVAALTATMPDTSARLFHTELSVDLLELGLDPNHPLNSRAIIKAGLQIKNTTIQSATGRMAGSGVQLAVQGQYRPNEPLAFWVQAPIRRLRLLDSSGKQQTMALSLPNAKLDVAIQAKEKKAQISGLARISDLVIGKKSWSKGTVLKWEAQANLKKPSLQALVETADRPKVSLQLKTSFEKPKKRLQYELDLRAQQLQSLAPLLLDGSATSPQIDLDSLQVLMEAKGHLDGVIQRFRQNGTPVLLHTDWTQHLVSHQGHQQLRLAIRGIDLKRDTMALKLPQLSLQLDARQEQGPSRASMDFELSQLDLTMPDTSVSVRGFQNSLQLEAPDRLDKTSLRIRFDSTLQHLAQSVVPVYPVKDARIQLSATLDRLSSLKIESFKIENPAAGTDFGLTMTIEDPALVSKAGPLSLVSTKEQNSNQEPIQDGNRLFGRQALSASGRISQHLDQINPTCDKACFSGKLTVPFQVESGDLSAFLVAASALAEDVSVSGPEAPLQINGFSGHIPLAVNVTRDAGGQIRLLAGQLEQLYTRARFSDVHPFIQKAHFLAVQNISVLGQTIGPIAGNLRLERDTLFLDQLQIAYRGGKISGQLIVRTHTGKPKVFFRGNLTGIRPSQTDEVLDANATLSFSLSDLALNGRIQIVRIGRAHLLDLLKLLDPYGEDTDINRVRLALKVGYPRFVRLVLQDGFLKIKVKLGGVGKLVSLQIRNKPLEPLINRFLVPHLPQGVFGDDQQTKPHR